MTPFEISSQPFIQLMVEALAHDPRFTPVQSRLRTEAIVHGVMAFMPFEPVRTMLASQAVGLHLTLLDMFRDLTDAALPDALRMRVRSQMNTQVRTMLALVKESRITRKEMLAEVQVEVAAKLAAAPEAALSTQVPPGPAAHPPVDLPASPATDPPATDPPATDPMAMVPSGRSAREPTGPAAATGPHPRSGGHESIVDDPDDDAAFAATVATFQENVRELQATLAKADALDPAAVAAGTSVLSWAASLLPPDRDFSRPAPA